MMKIIMCPIKKNAFSRKIGVPERAPALFFITSAALFFLFGLSLPLFSQTELGVKDDLTVLGTNGTAIDPNTEIKGFTVFGSTQPAYAGGVAGPGNVVVNGALAVSSGAYFTGNSTFTTGMYVMAVASFTNVANIYITGGTDNQVLAKNGNTGPLKWTNSSALGDNLGDHTATQNLKLNNFWLSNDGGNEGLAIDNSGNVGVGIAPAAKFHAHEATGLGAVAGNAQLLTRISGVTANYFMDNKWLYRKTAGADWTTAVIHDGISVDASFLVPGTSTRVWWERDPQNDAQSWGNAAATYMTLKGGGLGIGTPTPGAKLEVAGEQTFAYPAMGLGKGTIHVSPVTGANDNTSAITFGANSGSLVNSGQAGIYVQSSGAYGTRMYFGTTNSYAAGSQQRMMIDAAGNVGIGMTPGGMYKVDVSGTVNATAFRGDGSGLINVPAGAATSANYLNYRELRTIAPNSEAATTLRFGFTSYANNNSAPYADYLHLRSYTDGTGGNDNLVMFRKDAIGMRIWQQAWGSATAYSSYKDMAFTDGTNATGSWPISITGTSAGGPPSGAAGGNLGGTYPNPSIASLPAISGAALTNLNAANISAGTAGISVTGNAATATKLNSQGDYAAATPGTTRGPAGLNMFQVYANGYPTTYGNLLHMTGAGGGQLLIGWSGVDGSHADNYIRSKRDNDTGAWSPWAKILTDINFNSYAPTLTGVGASGSWPINITGTSAGAAPSGPAGGNLGGTYPNPSIASLPAISGAALTSLTGASVTGTVPSATNSDKVDNYHASDLQFFQSDRDFPAGTLIQSNIDYSVTNGEPFLLEIEGNSYGSAIPFQIKVQGYIYSNTILSLGGISNGTNLTGLVAFNYLGKLCFWFPSQGYWHGYSVNINDSYGGVKKNRLVSVSNAAHPGGTTKEVAFTITQGLSSGNFNSYAPTLTGGGASGSWPINITGTSAGAAPSGAAGGNLGGTYPNPSIASLPAISGASLTSLTAGNISAGTAGINISGNASTLSNFSVAHGVNPDTKGTTGIHYFSGGGTSPYADGALYQQAYQSAPTSWGSQLMQDYRTGKLAVRGLNSAAWTPWLTVLDSSNFNSYAPTLTGTGASGTWPISISGSVGSANLINGTYTGGGGLQPPSYIPNGQVRFNMMTGVPGTAGGYQDWLMMDTYTGADVPYVTMIGVSKTAGVPVGYIAVGAKGGATWAATPIITGSNIGSQSVAYATNSSKLYSTDPVYAYGSGAPYYGYLTYTGSRWRLNVSPATPAAVEVAYADTAGSAGSAGSVAWANITSKPITVEDGGRDNSDFNAHLQTGFYNGDSAPTNAPNVYGQMIVARGIDTGLQIAGGYNSDSLYFRGWWGSGAGFSAWRTLLHNGNFNSYAPTLTGTGASGTWPISITGNSDTLDSLHAASFLRKDITDTMSGNINFSNIRYGVNGLYSSATNTQSVWAMDPAYALPVGGATGNYGSLYGLGWAYNPDYLAVGNNPQSKAGLDFQLLLMSAGVTKTAIGSGVWTAGDVTATGSVNATGHVTAAPVVGKWSPNSTSPSPGNITWNLQTINTDPSYFTYTAGADKIVIAKAGHYLININTMMSGPAGATMYWNLYRVDAANAQVELLATPYSTTQGTTGGYTKLDVNLAAYFNAGDGVQWQNPLSAPSYIYGYSPYSTMTISKLN